MKLALISDIHSNLPALEAVLDDIAGRSDVVATYHLGDLVGYSPWPNEVVELIRQHGIAGVAGNYDSTTATNYKHCGCRSENPVQEAEAHESYAWTRDNITPGTRQFLGALPFRLDVRPFGGHLSGPKLVLVHGSPALNTLYWTADRPPEFAREMGKLVGAREGDVLACGHTHLHWDKEVDGVRFVNTGSVGRPKDGDPRAGYVLLGWDPAPSVEYVRVSYDVERVAEAVLASTLPDSFADFLRRGGAFHA